MKYFIYIFLLCITTLCNVYSMPICEEQGIQSENIYVQADDLLIQDDGIYLIQETTAYKISMLLSDDKGLYIKRKEINTMDYNCPNRHPIYHSACRGCANWWCSFRCKCYSPW